MSNYTTKTASLRATKANIGNLTVKKLVVLEENNRDDDGITLPDDYYKFIGRTSLNPSMSYALLDDSGKEIYSNNKPNIKKLIDGSKLYYNNRTLETWVDSLQHLEIAENMFANSSLVTFDTFLPMLRNGQNMFANSDLKTFNCTTLATLTNGNGMFMGTPLTTTFTMSFSNLTDSQNMFANCCDSSDGLKGTISLSLASGDIVCANMFNGAFINNVQINTNKPLKGDKMFMGAKATSSESIIDISEGQFSSMNNMFTKWDGKITLPSEIESITSANYAFSQIKPFGEITDTTPIGTTNFKVTLPSSLLNSERIFERAIIDNPQIDFLLCDKLDKKDGMFENTKLRQASQVLITNEAQTTVPSYVYLPQSSSSMNYSGYFSKIDTTKVPTLNVTLKAEDNSSFNCDNMFTEGKFNVINFNNINGVTTDSVITSFSSKNIFKTTTSNTLNFTIDNVVCENVDLSSAFEDATIENLTFTAKSIKNGYKMFKNAQIGTVTKLNIESIKNGNEAFADSTITTIGTADGQGINLTNTTSAHKMFENCQSITTTYPLTLDALQDASFMFAFSSTPHLEITSIPFTKAESMFEGAAQLEYAFIAEDIEIDEGNTLKRIDNLSSASTLKNLFKGCSNLSHPAKGFEAINAEVITRAESQNIQSVPYHLNISTATSLESAFEECTKMKFIDIYAPSATSIRSAFKNCTAIERIGLECPNLIDGKSAFEECYNLKEIDLTETFATGSTAKLINGENMFKGCSIKFKVDKTNCSWASLEIGNGMFSEMTVPTSIDETKHLSFSDNWDFTKLVLGRDMFKNTSITSVQMNLKKLQDGCGMFKNTNLTTIDTEIEKQFDSLVTALDMFSGCALDLDSVQGVVQCLKNNSGLTETNTTNKTFEPLLSNSAKALITNYDGTKYNDVDCIGVMTIDCNVADFGVLINNLAEFTTEIIEQTATSAHITVTNVNNAVWNVYINKNN